LCAYITPAKPAKKAPMTKAVTLYLLIFIPTDSAAISLSLIAVIALPVLDLTRFTINIIVIEAVDYFYQMNTMMGKNFLVK